MNYLKSILSLPFILLLLSGYADQTIQFKTENLVITLNTQGQLMALEDVGSGKNYLAPNQETYLLSLKKGETIYQPTVAQWDGSTETLRLNFKPLALDARMKVAQKSGYVTFELQALEGNGKEDIDLVLWGPFSTTIGQTVGETVGVVRDNDYAIGIQALNIKTLGGYPTQADDTDPAYDIFASTSLVDIPDSLKVLYRGQTAMHTPEGSKLQAYCRNRNTTRTISVWNHEYYTAPAYDDGGITGTKIALFGCPPAQALEVIGNIELAEGLPHPVIDGEWGKTATAATASYLIMPFSEDNLDESIKIVKQAGLRYLYHGGPFETWGHFELQKASFPDNWESMRRCVESAEKEGVRLGVHTLSNFITTNDPYVTPIPDPRLAKVGESKLIKNISPTDTQITIEDPKFFNQMKNNNLHTVLVGDELVRYGTVSETQPYTLLNCARGAFGTKATTHEAGSAIAKLMDHGYKTFLGNTELSMEMARTLADLFNTTGLRQISFDGLEGNWASGMGQFGRQLFVQQWYDHLKPELKGKVINDASNPGHFFWHIYTRMNWGEPWYAGFRESQTQYRILNQDYFRRNLMPSMLGWFNLTASIGLEDVEWMLARAAGFNAGFALNVSLDALRENGLSNEILATIQQWETARMSRAFTPAQQQQLQNIHHEFHIEKAGDKQWKLFQVNNLMVTHENKQKQPGEPVFSTIDFQNPYQEQVLQWQITASGDGEQAQLSKVIFEIDHYKTVEIPVTLQAGYHFKYEGKQEVTVYDPNWKVIQKITVNPADFLIAQGDHTIILDSNFSTTGKASLKVEFKTIDKGEIISPE